MRKICASKIYVMLQMCVMTLALAVFAVMPSKAVAQEDTPVCLKIATPTRVILSFQPLRLLIEAKARRTFKGAFDYGRMILYISDPKGNRAMDFHALETGLAVDSFPDAKAQEYPENYMLNRDELALYDFRKNEYIFAHPATYKIRASIDIFVGEGLDDYKPIRIESNSIEVHVLPPKWDEDAAAKLWKKQSPDEGPEINRVNALALIDSHPKTSYAQYARFYLSSNGKIGLAKRTAILNEFIKEGPPARLKDRAFLKLADIALEQGNSKEAHAYVEKVLALPEASKKSKDEALSLLGVTKQKAGK